MWSEYSFVPQSVSSVSPILLCPSQPSSLLGSLWDFQMMVIFEDLLLICTAPIQAFFCNLFPILLLLQPSHQNFNLDVDYSTPEILKYLLLSPHFSLFSPNHLCPFVLPWADIPPTMPIHTPFGSLFRPPLLFPSYSKFWFYLLWSCRQTFCGISSYFILHPLSVFHQFSFSIHVLHAKLRKQQQLKKDLNKVCGYYPLVP